MAIFFTLATNDGITLTDVGGQYVDAPTAKAAADLLASKLLKDVYVLKVIGFQSPRLPVISDWNPL